MSDDYKPNAEYWDMYDVGLLKEFFSFLDQNQLINEDEFETLYDAAAKFMEEKVIGAKSADYYKKEILK